MIIPTAVDTERFAPTRHAPRAVERRWSDGRGLSGNYPQLAHRAAGISRALKRTGARFVVISDRPPPRSLAALNAEFVRWRPESEVGDLAALDVGVMPLPDGPYERGKCAFKLLQYMALGRPGVASPVGANSEVVTDRVDGFLPESDDAVGRGSHIAHRRPVAATADGRPGPGAGRTSVFAGGGGNRDKALIETLAG